MNQITLKLGYPEWAESRDDLMCHDFCYIDDHCRHYNNVILWQPYGAEGHELAETLTYLDTVGLKVNVVGGSFYHPTTFSVVIYRPEDEQDAIRLWRATQGEQDFQLQFGDMKTKRYEYGPKPERAA